MQDSLSSGVSLARPAGYAALEESLDRKIREARRMLRKTRENGYALEARGPQGWEGYAAALVNIRDWLRRREKVPHVRVSDSPAETSTNK